MGESPPPVSQCRSSRSDNSATRATHTRRTELSSLSFQGTAPARPAGAGPGAAAAAARGPEPRSMIMKAVSGPPVRDGGREGGGEREIKRERARERAREKEEDRQREGERRGGREQERERVSPTVLAEPASSTSTERGLGNARDGQSQLPPYSNAPPPPPRRPGNSAPSRATLQIPFLSNPLNAKGARPATVSSSCSAAGPPPCNRRARTHTRTALPSNAPRGLAFSTCPYGQ